MTHPRGEAPKDPSRRRWVHVAVRLLLSVGVLALLLLIVPWGEVTAAAARITILLYAVALAGYLAGHAVGTLKWRLVLGASGGGARLTVRDSAGCYSAGLFANLFLPTVVGGDVVRAALAARALGRPEAVVLGGIADRVIDFAGLGLLIAGGAIFAVDVAGWAGPLAVIGAVVVVAVGSLLLPLILRRPLSRWPRRFRRRIGRGLVALRHLARRPGLAVGALLMSVAMQSLFIIITARLGHAVGAEAPLWGWFIVWPLAKAAGMMPVSLGGLGVRDAALTSLLVPFGVPAARGLVASLAWDAVVIGGTAIAGVVALVLRPDRPASRAARTGRPSGDASRVSSIT